MKEISRGLIESIANSENDDFVYETDRKVNGVVSAAIEDLSRSLPFVSLNNCVLQPVNELFCGAATPESEYVYFLGIDSPQLQLNCIEYNDSWKKFKERLIYAWNSSKKPKRKSRRSRRKEEAAMEKAMQYQVDTKKYNLSSLKDDLQKAFAKTLSETSLVYNYDTFIKMIGRDDFGIKTQIYIYPCIWHDTDFKFFISRKKGFYNINFETRAKLIDEKIDAVGDIFLQMLKVFNSLFRSTVGYGVLPNEIFLESLLYNTPNELFKGKDVYDVFIKIANYLNLTDVSQFKSILNPQLKISEDKATKSNQIAFLKFLNTLNKL